MNRRTFNQWIEAFGEQPPEHEEPRVPVSGRIRRKAELPAIKVPEPYRDDPRMQDRPAQSIDYEATHEYIDPEMEGVTIMVTKEHPAHIEYIVNYGKTSATGSSPIEHFKKTFRAIPQAGMN